jgi:putative NIF3 family GTP cyclohydrolase 1 type 2
VRFLLDRDMSLLAYHLPLDAHPVVGNNARIIRLLGASRGKAFGVYDGMDIGYVGTFRSAQTLSAVARKLKKLSPAGPMVFACGPKKIKRFGVVSGGAGDLFTQAVEEGLDLYITGEPYEPAQAICRESGINFMALGHHNSEKTGVEALAGWLRQRFRIPAAFVDIPNPA